MWLGTVLIIWSSFVNFLIMSPCKLSFFYTVSKGSRFSRWNVLRKNSLCIVFPSPRITVKIAFVAGTEPMQTPYLYWLALLHSSYCYSMSWPCHWIPSTTKPAVTTDAVVTIRQLLTRDSRWNRRKSPHLSFNWRLINDMSKLISFKLNSLRRINMVRKICFWNFVTFP